MPMSSFCAHGPVDAMFVSVSMCPRLCPCPSPFPCLRPCPCQFPCLCPCPCSVHSKVFSPLYVYSILHITVYNISDYYTQIEKTTYMAIAHGISRRSCVLADGPERGKRKTLTQRQNIVRHNMRWWQPYVASQHTLSFIFWYMIYKSLQTTIYLTIIYR
jgi:hypothetical protein